MVKRFNFNSHTIYTYRETDRDKESEGEENFLPLSLYIYIYTERERKRERVMNAHLSEDRHCETLSREFLSFFSVKYIVTFRWTFGY